MKLLRKFRLIYLAPVLAFIALSAWVFASPMGSSPDDDFHLTSIWCAQGDRAGACEPAAASSERAVPEALVESGCYIRDAEQSAACQADKVSFDPQDTVVTTRGNFNGGYPPVYYAVMSLFVSPDILTSVVVMRFVNVVLFLGLTSALYALLARRLRPALVWGWLVTTIPLGIFLIPSNNPSSWAIFGVGSAWLALLGWFTSEGRRKIGLGIVFAVSTLFAAGSRSDAAVYVVLGIAVVVVLTASRTRRFLLDSILPAVAIVACAVSVLSSTQSVSAINGFGGSPTDPTSGPVAGVASQAPDFFSLFAYNLLHIPSLWAGALGTWSLGWFDTVLPEVVGFGSIGCFVGVAFLGFGSLSRRKAIALTGVGITLIILPVYVLTRGGSSVGVEVQPRYLLPAIVIFAGLLVLSVGRRKLQFTRGQVILIVTTLSIIQFVALYTNMRRYITGTDAQGANLNAGIEWWWNIPFSPMVVLIVGSLAYAGLVAILARQVTGPRASTETRADARGEPSAAL